MPPTSMKLLEHIAFAVFVCSSSHQIVTLFDTCHNLRTMQTTVLKFYIWISQEKLGEQFILSFLANSYFQGYPPF